MSPGRPVPPVLLLTLIAGCYGDRFAISDLPTIDLVRETVVDAEVTAAAPARPFRVAATTPDGVVLVEYGSDGAVILGANEVAVVGAGATPDGELLVATPADLLLWSGGVFSPIGLGGAWAGSLVDARPVGDDLWLRATGGLYRLRGASLSEVRVDGMALGGPFAPGGSLDGAPIVWASTATTLFALDAESFVVRRALDVRNLTGLAVDATGALWAVVDGDLLRVATDGEESLTRFEEPLRSVYAEAAADGVWVAAKDNLLFASGGEFVGATTDRVYDARVDELGRLLVPGPFSLDRLTAGKVVGVMGLADGASLAGDATITLVATSPEDVAEAVLDVDGSEIVVDLATMTGALVASAWLDYADHTVTARVTWADGETAASGPLGFRVASLGDVTWAGEVLPLYTDRCAICHSGDTETILDSEQAWIDGFDQILEMVGSGAMPIGGPALTDGEIQMLNAWRDGGFL